MDQPSRHPNPSPNPNPGSDPEPTLVYYDGWCSACTSTAGLLSKIDKGRGVLECVDLRGEDPRIGLAGVDRSELVSSLHTRTPDGTLYAGPEAIRVALRVLGRRHSAAWTGWPGIRPIVDVCYRVFARNRLKWFGNHQCDDGACPINKLDQ